MLTIGGVKIGGDSPCRFIAEISGNHNGDFARALRLIDAAKNIGCDFVKFQAFEVAELVALRGDGPAPEPWGSAGWTMQTLYEKAQTPLSWFPELAAHCASVGIAWFSSVFGGESMRVLRGLNCSAYKVASLDRKAMTLRQLARMAGKPVIMSVAGAYEDVGYPYPDAKLWCPPGYPQPNFGFAPDLFFRDRHEEVSGFDGFSFHGTDPAPCVVAATLGAGLIEAHLQLDEEPSDLEANVSLTVSAFGEMIRRVRDVERMLA